MSPSQPESYDIAIEVPATALDQTTAPLLQHLNTSRDVEQVSVVLSTSKEKKKKILRR